MTPQERTKIRLERINRRGLDIATKLSALMAGKNVTLADIGTSGPDMADDKEQRLRVYLAMINEARRVVSGGEYVTKVAAEDAKRQLYLDDNPWMEGERGEVDGEA